MCGETFGPDTLVLHTIWCSFLLATDSGNQKPSMTTPSPKIRFVGLQLHPLQDPSHLIWNPAQDIFFKTYFFGNSFRVTKKNTWSSHTYPSASFPSGNNYCTLSKAENWYWCSTVAGQDTVTFQMLGSLKELATHHPWEQVGQQENRNECVYLWGWVNLSPSKLWQTGHTTVRFLMCFFLQKRK